jgi:hypothetical protein
VADATSAWKVLLPDADLSGIRFTIADLPGLQLGWTIGTSTTIDATAAGWGWGTTRMDLYTVVLHELGRALGYTTDDADTIGVMQATLAAGERVKLDIRLPAANAGRAAVPQAVGLQAGAADPDRSDEVSPQAAVRLVPNPLPPAPVSGAPAGVTPNSVTWNGLGLWMLVVLLLAFCLARTGRLSPGAVRPRR